LKNKFIVKSAFLFYVITQLPIEEKNKKMFIQILSSFFFLCAHILFFGNLFRLVFTMPAVGRDGMSTTQGSTTMYQITSSNPDGENTVQELFNLVNYFEVSRVELKNV